MTTQSCKTTGRCTHDRCAPGRERDQEQKRPRNRQSHLRRTCKQNTASSRTRLRPVVVRRQAPMARQCWEAQQLLLVHRDHRDPRPDAAADPSSQSCERSVGDTETVADHAEDPEDCRDATGAADGHARCDTRQALEIQKCSRPWSSHRPSTLKVSPMEWLTLSSLCDHAHGPGQHRQPRRSHRCNVRDRGYLRQTVKEKTVELVKVISAGAVFGTNCGADRTRAGRDSTSAGSAAHRGVQDQ